MNNIDSAYCDIGHDNARHASVRLHLPLESGGAKTISFTAGLSMKICKDFVRSLSEMDNAIQITACEKSSRFFKPGLFINRTNIGSPSLNAEVNVYDVQPSGETRVIDSYQFESSIKGSDRINEINVWCDGELNRTYNMY